MRTLCFVACAVLVCGSRQETLCCNTTLATLSRHKIFCRKRHGPALGKLCRDIRGPLSRPKHLVLAPKPCRDTKFLSRNEAKNLCRDRESLYHDPNRPVCLGTLSRHGDPCHDTGPEALSSALAALSRSRPIRTCMPVARTLKSSCAPGLRTLSRHGRPCRNTGVEKPCHDRNFSIAVEDLKCVVALSGPPAPLVFPFSFLSLHPNLNTQ